MTLANDTLINEAVKIYCATNWCVYFKILMRANIWKCFKNAFIFK